LTSLFSSYDILVKLDSLDWIAWIKRSGELKKAFGQSSPIAFVYNRLASLQAILLVPPFTLGGYNILPLTPFNFFGSFYRPH
jgi:hypothetical protein